MLVRITNREDPDQTASFRSSLIWVCTVCLGFFGEQLVFKKLLYSYLGLVTRKPLFGVCRQVRLKPICTASEASY